MNRKRIFWVLMLLLPLALFFVGGEVAMRIYYGSRYGGSPLVLDDELGWRPRGGLRFKGYRKDASGQRYNVDIRTDEKGFRMFGSPNPNPERKRVLFIGDSFTYALEVSTEKTYYGIIGRTLPIDVFAIGCSGYGTLQEYLLLDQYVGSIKPDVIVVQFCFNDFINNSYELELRSGMHNNGMRRPYLNREGKTVYSLPGRFSQLREFANRHSRFLYFLFSRMDRFMRPKGSESSEGLISARGRAFPPFDESIQTTEQVLRMIRASVPPRVEIYAFGVDDLCPYYQAFMEAAQGSGIQVIDGVAQAVRRAEEKGVIVHTEDGWHWNEAGHRIAGEKLIEYLKEAWKGDDSHPG